MNPLLAGFKQCAHLTGEACGFTNGKLIRQFGLGDFLDNVIGDCDDAAAIAVKALDYFCEGGSPHGEKFKFGVLAVGLFLNHHLAKRERGVRNIPQQALRDLVALLVAQATRRANPAMDCVSFLSHRFRLSVLTQTVRAFLVFFQNGGVPSANHSDGKA